MSQEQPKLGLHEWGAVIAYITLLASIALYTLVYVPYKYPEPPSNPHWLLDPYIDVYITGAIEKPGQYRMRRGSTRADLLTLVNPHQNADLKRLKTTAKLREGELIEIPSRQMITVYVQGEVEQSRAITIEKGTKVFEIQKQIKPKPGADLAPLAKKRPLKDGEIIRLKKKKN